MNYFKLKENNLDSRYISRRDKLIGLGVKAALMAAFNKDMTFDVEEINFDLKLQNEFANYYLVKSGFLPSEIKDAMFTVKKKGDLFIINTVESSVILIGEKEYYIEDFCVEMTLSEKDEPNIKKLFIKLGNAI